MKVYTSGFRSYTNCQTPSNTIGSREDKDRKTQKLVQDFKFHLYRTWNLPIETCSLVFEIWSLHCIPWNLELDRIPLV